MSRREIGWSDRGMITGSGINLHCTACYDRAMRRPLGVVTFAMTCAVWLALPAPVAAQGARSDLAAARTHYNQRRFDDAITAASTARRQTDVADLASIVLARAHLERYRERADPSDLGAAREALGAVRAGGLDARDRLELLLALGESLFLEDDFGAAAAMFESGVSRAADTDGELAEAMLEWWGSAVERHAGTLERDSRVAAFRRLADGMTDQLRRDPSSMAANYWSVVALRGAGETDRAWDHAVAAWVRARLIGARAPGLRADLDRVVLQGIIPDRVRPLPVDQRAAAESQLKADWQLVKEKWK